MTIVRILPLLLLMGMAMPMELACAAGVDRNDHATSSTTEMHITSVELTARPMLYVSETTPMTEMPALMNTAFATLGQFLKSAGVTPIGPPMAVFHAWSGDSTAVDIGFPVTAADARKASGSVLGGMSPGGFALKVVHVGPYVDFPATYAAIQTAMRDAGIADSTRMWEVYLGQPGITPDAELVTEIYMQVTSAEAAKFPAE
jgi:effector-binding domain-containing protein